MLLKLKQDAYFVVVGSVLMLILFILIVYSMKFLIINIKTIIIGQSAMDEKKIVEFNIGALKKLGIMK